MSQQVIPFHERLVQHIQQLGTAVFFLFFGLMRVFDVQVVAAGFDGVDILTCPQFLNQALVS